MTSIKDLKKDIIKKSTILIDSCIIVSDLKGANDADLDKIVSNELKNYDTAIKTINTKVDRKQLKSNIKAAKAEYLKNNKINRDALDKIVNTL